MALLSTPLFALLIVAHDYLEIFHLEIVFILGNRVVRFKDVSKKRSKGNGNLIFVVDEARFVKFIRIRKMLRGELERQK